MPASLTSVTAILKEVYEGPISDQLVNDVIGLKRIERTSEGVTSELGGKYVVFPLRIGRNAGIGARNELEVLPSPGQQGYNAGRVSLKYLYGSCRISGQTFELADSNFQAFASAADLELSGLKSDLLKDQNRQFYGTGMGVLGTATATNAANTFPVLAGTGAKYFEVGQAVDIVDGTTLAVAFPTGPTVKASNRVITAINAATGAITFSGAVVSTAVGDIMVRTGSVRREVTGLASVVNDTGALYNIDPATENYWKASVEANAGSLRPLSEGLMIYTIDRARQQGGHVSVGFCGLGVRRAYFELLVQTRRTTNTQDFDGGFKGLAFSTDQGDVPIVVDTDCTDNTLWFPDEKQIKFYREHEWKFMERDGSMWQRVVAVGGVAGNYDAYEATMFQYAEMGTHKRNAHAVLKDLTEG